MSGTGVMEMARLGTNPACVDCGDVPFGGGMRCWDCFKARCAPAEKVEHVCTKHVSGVACYTICRCRCDECREAKSVYTKGKK